MMSKVLGAAIVMAALVWAAQAQAQTFGVRAGASADPDQFYVGVHADTRPFADRISFRPNVEVGIGDRTTLVAVNLEFVFRQPLQGSEWSVFAGAGPAANFYSFDGGRGRNDSDLGGGLNLLVGMEHRDGFFAEVKVGLLDSPEIKFGIGFSFGR